MRVLLAAHGYEPPGWATEACRVVVVAKFGGATVRVLAVLDVPCPAFTSLTPRAATAYRVARAAWTRAEAVRVQGVIDEVSPYLGTGGEVVRVPAVHGDLARTIAEHVDEWPADIAVVGAPLPGVRRWLWPGPVHERVLRRLPCAVMVIPAPPVTSGGGVRRAAAQWAICPWRRPTAASHGA
jgi:nucleotide-binding universal stress UspA family protein